MMRNPRHSIILFSFVVLFSCTTPPPALDVYITNAMILDGTGTPPYPGYVGITADSISFLSGQPYDGEYDQLIDANNHYVSPGFIDLHAHGNPFQTPEFENFLAMGVTTIVLGQDGSGPVSDLPKWRNYIDSSGTGVNIAMMIGHGSMRDAVGAKDSISEAQLDQMSSLLNEYLSYSFGMSTGLEYTPGLYAAQEELEVLASVVGKHDKVIMSHMRNEDDNTLLRSIAELAAQGAYSKVHIAHLKSVYGKGETRATEILSFIDSLRAEGVAITADMYPYTASYTGISILFPDWCKTNEQFEVVRQTRRDELHAYLTQRIIDRNGPEATLFGTDPFTGKTLQELATHYNLDPADFLIDIVGPQGASGAYFIMDQALQEKLMQYPFVAICSDGSPTGFHPRGHGTFARILEEFVVKRRSIQLSEAIRKMTSLPAEILQIEDRGILREGMKADLLIFDLEQVKEKATYSSPLQLSEGFRLVFVNGKLARKEDVIQQLSGYYIMP